MIVINIHDGACNLPQAQSFQFWIRNLENQTIRIKGENMLLLTDVQGATLRIQPVSAHGNPAKVDGVPSWSVADSSLLSLDVDDAGLVATIRALGPVGTTQVNVTADADMGEGTRPIAGVLDVQVESGEAVSLAITAEVLPS